MYIVPWLHAIISIFHSRPAYATPKLLDKTGLKLSDIDVFEYHEAFAVSHNTLHNMKTVVQNVAITH